MTTVTQRLMSGLGQAGSDWSWSWTVSIHDTSYEPDPSVTQEQEQVTEASCASEDPETTAKSHDHSSGTSDPVDL